MLRKMRYNYSLIGFKYAFCAVLFIIVQQTSVCHASPKPQFGAKSSNPTGETWVDKVTNKLNIHVRVMEASLERYLYARYLPYLRIVGAQLDHKQKDRDSGLTKQTKALLRLGTLHAYFTIHQTALTSGAIHLMNLLLKSKQQEDRNYQLKDGELLSSILYLNYQIRLFNFEHKGDYLLEFTYLCHKFEAKENVDEESMDHTEKFIDYVKAKTRIIVRKIDETREEFIERGKQLKYSVKSHLDFEANHEELQEFIDEFYRKHGLEALISGCLHMSQDDSFMGRGVKRTTFKKFFENCNSKIDKESVFAANRIDSFDPVIPTNLDVVPSTFESKSENFRENSKLATDKMKNVFHEELIKNALPQLEEEKTILIDLILSFERDNIGSLMAQHDKNEDRSKIARALVIKDLAKMTIEYQLLKMCVLERFINLAKTFIGYDNTKKLNFIVPFDNRFFALHVQKLVIGFYHVMMSQISRTWVMFNEAKFDQHRALVNSIGKAIPESSELANALDRFYAKIKLFNKRDRVIAKLKAYNMKVEMVRFRKLPIEAQGYYVSFNGFTTGNVLSLFLESSLNDKKQLFDFVQKRFSENAFSHQTLGKFVMTTGKQIEALVLNRILSMKQEESQN